MQIQVNSGLPPEVVTALQLREGRQAYDEGLKLDGTIVPVAIVAGGGAGGQSDGSPDLGFMSGAQAIVAGGGGTNVMAQLKNPADSRRAIQLTRAWGYAAGASSFVSMRRYDVDLTTLANVGLNRRLGQIAAIGQVRTQNTIAVPGTAVELYSHPGGLAVLADFQSVLSDSPIQIDPGQGIIFTINATTVAGVFSFNWREFNLP